MVLLIALGLRLQHLESRPIHADEATGARILAQRLEGNGYSFDPTHYHGPILSLSTTLIANCRNEGNWSELSPLTLRLGPALAGLLVVLTPLLWIPQFGARSALAAGALLATSPLLVYYNRMHIHESWLMLFGMLSLTAIYRLARKPGWGTACWAGLCIGLMFATKETFVISILSWALAVAVYLFNRRMDWTAHGPLPQIRTYSSAALLLIIWTIVTAAYFYSEGFRNWQGFADALRTYFVYETTAGHEKPLFYYLHFLLWPKNELGMWWTEVIVALLALEACLHSIFKRTNVGTISFLTVATLGHFVIYSLIGYKTPWLMLLPWAHCCLLAGSVFSAFDKLRPVLRLALTLLLIGGITFQTQQSLRANGRIANDARNPYAYVPTSRDPQKLATWLQQLQTLDHRANVDPIAVIGKDYWPLPWYLRTFESVGYWPQVPATLSNYPIVLAMPASVDECDDQLHASHTKLPRTLRANVTITLYISNELWTQWSETPVDHE